MKRVTLTPSTLAVRISLSALLLVACGAPLMAAPGFPAVGGPIVLEPKLPVEPLIPLEPVLPREPRLPVEPIIPIDPPILPLPSNPGDIEGDWENVDPATGGITRIVINREPGALILYPKWTAHAYGKCHPTDCDWGKDVGTPSAGYLTVVHEAGFKTATLTIRLLPEGLLHVHGVHVFHDGTARDYESDDYFRLAWDIADMLGDWENVDPDTGGITRLGIRESGGIVVHGYGRCHPTDCDWGDERALYVRGGLEAVYEPGFKVDTLTMKLRADGLLSVHSVNVFVDGSSRDYEADYVLRRAPRFVRGDVDQNAAMEISDAIGILQFLYVGGAEPPCERAADADDSGDLDMTDAVGILQFLFLGGPPCPPPADGCGVDPTLDALSCKVEPPCS